MGVLARLQAEGKIRHIGLSAVSVEQIERAQSSVQIATVQNEYNLGTRKHQDVVDYCTTRGIGFIPFYPLRIGELAGSERLKAVAGVTAAGVALAWLFKISPAIIAIPGTSYVEHINENAAVSEINLSEDEMDTLEALSPSPEKFHA
jgi:pyridoxine 4-dehydrogenase